jgi:hypothetical protein
VTFPFKTLLVDGVFTRPRAGDRIVYDETSGTMFVHREAGDVSFVTEEAPTPQARLFVGRGWTRALTRASCELYAKLGGLSGAVTEIEGSFPTLHVFEVRD